MKQLYQQLIKHWQNRPLPHIVQRQADISNLIDPQLRKIITITGFRRVGKTYLMLDYARQLGQKNCIYLNLEDERIPAAIESLTQFSDTLSELNLPKNLTLLLDEIQNIPAWSKWARRINQNTQYQLVLTGSSSQLSSAELPTELRGRSLNLHLNPLNFAEFLNFKQANYQQLPSGQQLQLVQEFVQFGGLPEIVLTDRGKKFLLLTEYFNTFVTRDLIERHQLKKTNALSTLIELILNCKEFTITKLTNTLKSLGHSITKPTVNNYLQYLQQSYFLQPLLWHSSSAKNRLQAARKTYLIDSFFLYQASKFSQNLGRLMEQVVFSNLHARLQRLPKHNLYYYRNQQRYEVDFVIQQQETTQHLVQVSYLRPGDLIPKREMRNLALAAEKLDCQQLTLVTWDLAEQQTVDGYEVELVPLDQFLLR
jgi:hypothetical protein